MQFKCFTDWHQLPKNSDDLFASAEKDSLFFSRAWFVNLTDIALEVDQSLLLACVVDVENALAILPLIKNPSKEWTSLSHRYSSLFTLLLSSENQEDTLNCLAQGLKQLPFEYLSLDPVADDDNAINALQAALQKQGFECYRTFRFVNWFKQLKGQSFAEYWAERPSKVRNTIERKQRKLEREQNVKLRLVTSQNEMQQALKEYHALYAESWKAREQFTTLVEALVQRFTDKGWTRMGFLTIDGKPIAAHLWFVAHQKASIFRLVYDQQWKQYSPGSVLMRFMMEYVIDTDKVKEIDFLNGNDRYKQDWMSESCEQKSLVCVNKPLSGMKKTSFIQTIRQFFYKSFSGK